MTEDATAARSGVDGIKVRRVDADDAATCVEELADVLIDCVEAGASVGFMRPLPRDRALAFWRGVAAGVARGERVLLVAEEAEGAIVGTVQIIVAMPENQPHRAEVAKMLVRRSARRRGVAQRLMSALDEAARQAGKTVLVLDTVTGSDAERLYERSGWRRVGVVPEYALMPDGALRATTFFSKHLSADGAAAARERAIHRGDLVWLAPDGSRGAMPSYSHPHVVIQDDVLNRSRITTTVVCALTSNLHRASEPGNVFLDEGEGDLPQRSVVVVSQIMSVDKTRLGERIGSLSEARLDQILAGLRFQQRSFFARQPR
jgi:mRNA-degrading endonuclease toxin of MazEF toxin-antitoxin module/GNAT superfamily N-acetyltransferase